MTARCLEGIGCSGRRVTKGRGQGQTPRSWQRAPQRHEGLGCLSFLCLLHVPSDPMKEKRTGRRRGGNGVQCLE